MDMINPWLGLLSYQDPDKSKSLYRFCGRESATGSLFAMIDNNLLVTLYGKTGIGKTSVLNAGVFPLLRSRNYLPISIRLGKYENAQNVSYAKCIVDEILSEIAAMGGVHQTKFPEYSWDNCLSTEFLWKFFFTSGFRNAKGEDVFPVIALDQLEEIFISNPAEAELLLKQISALIDDNRDVPDINGYSDCANFRFVFSIREDDLFYLEDCIDTNYLHGMKQNRYRLCPLRESEAREVVMLGKEMMEPGTEDEISIRVTSLAKDEYGRISTNLLSLVCSQLYVHSHGSFTINVLNTFSQNPLESFYLDCMSHVSDATREFIESHMVDQDRRKFVSRKDIKNGISRDDLIVLTSGEFKILQSITAGNTECVELIHDSIARTIFHMKNDAEERKLTQRLKWRNRRFKVVLCVISICLVSALYGISRIYMDNTGTKEMVRDMTEKIKNNVLLFERGEIGYGTMPVEVNGVKFRLKYVEKCSLLLGATFEQTDSVRLDEWVNGEKRGHQVTITNDFWIGETEVTQELWETVMGYNPSEFRGKDLPVEKVSWTECKMFVDSLSTLTGYRFALPTEAEWEVAARGGCHEGGSQYCGSDTLSMVAWYFMNSGKKPHPVAQLRPNRLGLYDMSGNVYEWCEDVYKKDYYKDDKDEMTDPCNNQTEFADGEPNRVFRGGSWFSASTSSCRVAFRNFSKESFTASSLGLRIVWRPERKPRM